MAAQRSSRRGTQQSDPLRITRGQQTLTPAQVAAAHAFAHERIAAQLSTAPVDEAEAEDWLRQAYRMAKLEPPQRMIWYDGPLGLVLLRDSVRASVRASVRDSVWASVGDSVRASVWASVEASVWASIRDSVGASVGASVGDSVEASVWDSVGDSVWDSVGTSVGASVRTSVGAYYDASVLAFYRFFHEHLAPNDLYPLARFNEMVSGYWLGAETALIVRKPRILSRDEAGRLHSATGKCMEYRDNWGFYAWHGVRVPEQVILRPDTLTRDDFLGAGNIEVRRVIQERMGERFVAELGGVVIDTGTRGTLYEVQLPADDPERVARYVEVQDASTPRRYFLRVPPTMQTAAAAVAWTFALTAGTYAPLAEA